MLPIAAAVRITCGSGLITGVCTRPLAGDTPIR